MYIPEYSFHQGTNPPVNRVRLILKGTERPGHGSSKPLRTILNAVDRIQTSATTATRFVVASLKPAISSGWRSACVRYRDDAPVNFQFLKLTGLTSYQRMSCLLHSKARISIVSSVVTGGPI